MIELESMAVAMPEVAGHPNRAAFRGVLTMVDVASQRAPSGAKGHLVMLTKQAAEAALPSLLGMALDYAPALDRHDVRRKVGVITRAEIEGRNLKVGGYLFARDFPEIVKEISQSRRSRGQDSLDCSAGERRQEPAYAAVGPCRSSRQSGRPSLRAALQTVAKDILSLTADPKRYRPTVHAKAGVASGSGLGLSYEVTDVQVEDIRARVWALAKVTFTGAAILRRDKAAYRDTWIELVS